MKSYELQRPMIRCQFLLHSLLDIPSDIPCQVEPTAQPPAAAESAVAPGTVGETPMVEREAPETHEVQHGAAGNPQWWFHEKGADAQVVLLHIQQRNHIWFSTPYLLSICLILPRLTFLSTRVYCPKKYF